MFRFDPILSVPALLISIALLAGLVVWKIGNRPRIHKVSLRDLSRYIGALFRRGYNQGFMVIQDPASDHFVQLSKYIRPDSIVGLRCDFPKAAWSAQYYARVEKELCHRKIPFSAFDTKSASGVTEFLVIDLESDPDAAVKLVRLIFQDVFGFPANYVVNIHFRNISVRDEMIR
jgi:hypothetical protein